MNCPAVNVLRMKHDDFLAAGRPTGHFSAQAEMEDLALRYREPDIYQTIAGRLQGKRTDREQQVAHMVDQVRGLLRSQGIEATVYGRAKNIFSIWRKMQNKGVDFDQVMDVRAVRVVVENLADCYAALGMLLHLAAYPRSLTTILRTPRKTATRVYILR